MDEDAARLTSIASDLLDLSRLETKHPQCARFSLDAATYSDSGSMVRVDRQDADLIVEVQDEGIGIPSRDMPRIFESFYRVDLARSRRRGGTGLGLAIVKHVAEEHEGTVEVESELGVGSTFRLRLPTR
ncbi:MAG: sensor histidine kinase [Acidimicrobiia bacterium]